MTRPRFITLDEANLKDKRVLLRVDFNVPIKDGVVADTSRINATIPTIEFLHNAGASVAILSHLGSPRPDRYDSDYSLAPVARYLSEAMNQDIPLVVEWLDELKMDKGEILMLENIRFARGEKANTDELARKMATLCDVYVNEAFASARREQSSVHGIAKYLPVAYTGPLFVREVEALNHALEDVKPPLGMIIGGTRRPETKFDLTEAQMNRADHILLCVVLANTFIKATGKDVGKSVYVPELLGRAEKILETEQTSSTNLSLPQDFICGTSMDEESNGYIKDAVDDADEMIMDIGPQTIEKYKEVISACSTLVWTGPMGVVELDGFAAGTLNVAKAVADNQGYTIANGGDTLAYIREHGLVDKFSHLSTGGGSSLEFLQGKKLPAVAMMEESARVRYAVEREY